MSKQITIGILLWTLAYYLIGSYLHADINWFVASLGWEDSSRGNALFLYLVGLGIPLIFLGVFDD